MTDVVIHRCTLRIVRRDGWSWGPEPQRLLSRAIDALPGLIARRLAELWPGDVHLDIAAPVRLTVPVKLSELANLRVETGDIPKPMDAQTALLERRVALALRTALQLDDDLAAEQARGKVVTAKQRPNESASADGSYDGGAILRILLRWREGGVLRDRLSAFSLHSLEAWHRALIGNTGSVDEASEVSEDVIRNLITAAADEFPSALLDRSTVLFRRLVIAVRVAGELDLSPDATRIHNELDRVLPLATSSAFEFQSVTERLPERAQEISNVATPPNAPLPVVRNASVSREIDIASALPFLLLRPLARLGYLEALAANLDAAQLLQHAPVFATALAYKVLDPPERGWRRTPSSVVAASAFASVAQPVSDPDLAEFDRRISDHLSPLDAALSGPLVEGHDRNQPLLLHRADSRGQTGFALLDVDGLFPLAWAGKTSDLFPLVQTCAPSHLLIPRDTAEPNLLSELNEAGVAFITDAQPTRNERWRSVRRGALGRWWTNDETGSESMLVTNARRLENSAAEASELWQTLSTDRPTLRADTAGALDRHLTRAAATALGTIAWELWRDREPTSPNLALERFGDLSARVTYTPDSVRVSLPLGRRHQDLRAHALLDDVRDVPWLGGRLLQFSGG